MADLTREQIEGFKARLTEHFCASDEFWNQYELAPICGMALRTEQAERKLADFIRIQTEEKKILIAEVEKHTATKQDRDSAQAEVERLKGMLEDARNLYPKLSAMIDALAGEKEKEDGV